MQEVTIGFLGCGNVGSGVWNLIQDMSEEIMHRRQLRLKVKRALVRSLSETRSADVPVEILTEDPSDVLEDPEISIVAEFMGGEEPATSYMLQALRAGKTVVTANKVALALNWHLLQKEAEAHGAGLYYEASVCAAIPLLGPLRDSLQANRITMLMGIINGTTNYILSQMAATGSSYEYTLAEAQRLGLAEPDPAADVEGLDAAYKLSIMASLAFHAKVPFAKVYREGITRVSAQDITWGRELGYVLKLLAIAKRSGDSVEVRVHPTFLPSEHPLSGVGGPFNAVFLKGHACDELMFRGRGAGEQPTASSVVGDILIAATSNEHRYPTFKNTESADPSLAFNTNWRTRYYIRLTAKDAPGVLASVAACFGASGVSIARVIQKDMPDSMADIVLITHEAEEFAVQDALRHLDKKICRAENMIRVEA